MDSPGPRATTTTRRGHQPERRPEEPDRDPDQLEPGTVVDGRYRIVRTIGRGETSCVYEARHEVTAYRSALRIFRRDLGHPSFVAVRAQSEITAPALVEHPRVVSVLDAGQDADRGVFIVTPFLVEPLLGSLDGPTSVDEATNLIVDLLGPLCAAHARGLVHGGLKPDHVMVSTSRKEHRVTLLDFGRALLSGPVYTRPRVLLRTVRYMSPEQIAGDAPCLASDVWAVGAMLYELVASRPPFEGDTVEAIAANILAGSMGPLAQAAPGVPSTVSALVERCLAKDPDERPDACMLRDALRDAAA